MFIPNKRSKITNQGFGFVRFNAIPEASRAIAEVHDSWCWGQNLLVKYARFLRLQDRYGDQQNNKRDGYQRNPRGEGEYWKEGRFRNRTYQNSSKWGNAKGKEIQNETIRGMSKQYGPKRGKEVWRRKGIAESSKQGEERNKDVHTGNKRKVQKSFIIQPMGNGWLSRSAVGRIRKLTTTQKLVDLFKKERGVNVQIKPIGGRYVIITFSDETTRDEGIMDRWLEGWFEEIKKWEGEGSSNGEIYLAGMLWNAIAGMEHPYIQNYWE